MEKLYYIAIYLPEELNKEIRLFMEDISLNFNSHRALKNDAHITLLAPFGRAANLEEDVHIAFNKIDTNIPKFEIELENFGCFLNKNNPVVFVKPKENLQLDLLRNNVIQHFPFDKKGFNPHITIGYKDLTPENFIKAWDKYKNMEYQRTFTVEKISLMRHDKKWITIAEKNLI